MLGEQRETRALEDLREILSVAEARSAVSLHALERFGGTRYDANARVAVPIARAVVGAREHYRRCGRVQGAA